MAFNDKVNGIGKQTFDDLKSYHPVYTSGPADALTASVRQSIEAAAYSTGSQNPSSFKGIETSVGSEMAYAWAYASRQLHK